MGPEYRIPPKKTDSELPRQFKVIKCLIKVIIIWFRSIPWQSYSNELCDKVTIMGINRLTCYSKHEH